MGWPLMSLSLPGQYLPDRSQRRVDPGAAMFRRQRQTLGPHERHGVDTQKAEQKPQVRLGKLARRIRRVHATARERDDYLLSARQPPLPRLGVAERLAGYGDPVDPGLQLG